MKSQYFLLITTFLVLFSCHRSSQITETYDNGVTYKTYHIDKDSLVQGKSITYFEDGKTPFEVAQYKNGQLHGIRSLYYANGQPEVTEHYRMGQLSDTVYTYYENGRIKSKQPYEDNVLSGIVIGYYPSGKIEEKVQFEDNAENGTFEEYYENGNPKWKGTYKDGENEVGELLKYDSSGILIKKLFCDSLSICKTTWSFGS